MINLISYMCVALLLRLVFSKPANVVLILTDDQDLLLGGMTPMKQTVQLLANEGVTFENAFVNTPVCCPSRSTLLSGRYQHNTRVLNNSIEGGCSALDWRTNLEPKSVASLLQKKGYNTFYAGKYLNRYGLEENGGVEHVPDGWSSWHGLVGNSRYYNYTISENGKAVHYKDVYLTDLIKEKALHFLNQARLKDRPFFMMMGTPAPHAPFTPAPRHQGTYPNVRALRTPAFNFTPTDKHWLLSMPPRTLPQDVTQLDNIQRHRFETLLSVDELVEKIVTKIDNINELNNTYVIYTSDNGYHIGQFCQPMDKRQPYDTDIRVPLLIRGPNLKKRNITTVPVGTVDLTPTILSMVGLSIPSYMDGQSFLNDIVENAKTEIDFQRNVIPIEYHGEGNANTIDESCPWDKDDSLLFCSAKSWCKCEDSKNNTYTCIRQVSAENDFLFCKFTDSENFKEAYNMTNDKYQLYNIYKDMNTQDINKYNNLISKYFNCSGEFCRNL